jgi:hypothetical protein
MEFETYALSFTATLFFGMLICVEIGRQIGIRYLSRDPDGARAGAGPVEGALFGLLGLLIAFTFSGAAARFDTRRQLIVEEANDIGTAYLRLELLPVTAQPALRDKFRQYVDVRLGAYRKLPDMLAAKAELAKATMLQGEIWRQAVASSRSEGASPAAPVLLLAALNSMIDITTTRTMFTQIHPPWIIFAMIFGLALTTSLFVGYGMAGAKARSWLHMLGLAFVMVATVYVIIDMEYPRFGLIRVDAFDQALAELRETMK